MFQTIDKNTIEIKTQTPLGDARIVIKKSKQIINVDLFHILINKSFSVNKLEAEEKIGHLLKWIITD